MILLFKASFFCFFQSNKKRKRIYLNSNTNDVCYLAIFQMGIDFEVKMLSN